MDTFSSPAHEGRSVLVLGGARSGKSRYAQALAETTSADRLFVATSEAVDEDMAARIAKHKADRGEGWTTLEEPVELRAVLAAEARVGRVVLVDCITLWLSNLMLAERDLAGDISGLAAQIADLKGPVVFVSNEVGFGVVPGTALGRRFRDWQGRANQELAAVCDAVVLVTAGLPRLMKPGSRPNLLLS